MVCTRNTTESLYDPQIMECYTYESWGITILRHLMTASCSQIDGVRILISHIPVAMIMFVLYDITIFSSAFFERHVFPSLFVV